MTAIQWTHQEGYKGETWNPIAAFNIETGKRGWMCTKPSAGCKSCYAEAMNRFRGNRLPYTVGSLDKVRIELVNIDEPLHWRKPRVAFVCSMTDLFHEQHSDAMIARIFATMALARWHQFIVLTKRPQRMRDLLNDPDFAVETVKRVREAQGSPDVAWLQWPLPNVRVGTTIENRAVAIERAAALRETPAVVRFLSIEPLLERINLIPLLAPGGIHWAIVGGESGGKSARPFDVSWAREIVFTCRLYDVRPFVKQLGRFPVDSMYQAGTWAPADARAIRAKDLLGLDVAPHILLLKDSHGGDIEEWPEDLRVREFPSITKAVA